MVAGIELSGLQRQTCRNIKHVGMKILLFVFSNGNVKNECACTCQGEVVAYGWHCIAYIDVIFFGIGIGND